ncbi:MAG: hypothetical protein LBV28_02745 [Puniceicoccales bacterium]|jgi:D-lyxose ketol-isomerase|nr:hypothetical protein [Puniceicoccales bacterium]
MKTKNLLLFAATAALTACAHNEGTPEQAKQPAAAKGAAHACHKEPLVFKNADFYTADGKFNETAAKEAIVRLMKFHNYPVTEKTRSQLWVSDYGTGHFTEVGLAAIMFENKVAGVYSYMLQDLFLLPGQMLPEHWHDPVGEVPAKMEGWAVRSGYTYTVGEGADNLAEFPEIKVPASHAGGVTAKSVVKLNAGDYNNLKQVGGHHWQFAGKEGAVITEVANVHSGEGVFHQVPSINAHFRKK